MIINSYPRSIVPNNMSSKIAMKCVWQAMLQFISVGTEQSLKWVPYYQKTDAVI